MCGIVACCFLRGLFICVLRDVVSLRLTLSRFPDVYMDPSEQKLHKLIELHLLCVEREGELCVRVYASPLYTIY